MIDCRSGHELEWDKTVTKAGRKLIFYSCKRCRKYFLQVERNKPSLEELFK